jgi:hypothetical protein
MRVRLFCCIAMCGGAAVCLAAGSAPDILRARQLMRDQPARFEPNLGQWNPRVRFFAHAGDSRLLLTSDEAVLAVGGRNVGLSLVDSNPAARITGLDPLAVRGNYFVGRDASRWRSDVTQYGRVRYAEVYPGVDLVYYGSAGKLEYDLVLRPGADPQRIRMKFRGADNLTVSPQGDLLFSAGDAQLVQKRPVIYQETAAGVRQQVDGRYKLLRSGEVGVEVAAYDRRRALTIDPTLVYSSLVGGGGSDAVTGVKVDKAGKVWVAGYTSTGDLTSSDGAYQPATGGGTNIFLARINPKGDFTNSLEYFTYIGGSGVDTPNAMTMDSNGFIYVAGSTTSANFPLGGNVTQNMITGGTDAFVLKFDPSASGGDQLPYSTYIGGSDTDVAYGIDVDAAGKIYVIGTTRSSDFPVTGQAYASVLYGPQDAFIAKYDLTVSPTLVYSSFFGSELADDGRGIAVTPSGTVYIAGSTAGTGLPQAGAQYQAAPNGLLDIWLAQMDLTRNGVDALRYSTYLGGSDLDEVRKLAIDPTGKVLLTGYTMSPDFPVTGNAVQKSLAGNADAFVVRVDFTKPQNGFIDYSSYLGGTHGDVGYDVTSDAAGNIYVTGYTLSGDFPLTQDAITPKNTGTAGFVTKLNPASGIKLYSSFVGSTGQHVGYGLAAGSDGTIYVGGITNIQDIFVSSNANQLNYGGGLSDGFLIVIGPQ